MSRYGGVVWLDYRQAAKRTGRSTNTVKRWRRNGMPTVMRDGRQMVRQDVLLSWYRDRLLADPIMQQKRRQASLRA